MARNRRMLLRTSREASRSGEECAGRNAGSRRPAAGAVEARNAGAGSAGSGPGCRAARRGSPRASTRSSPAAGSMTRRSLELEELLIASDMGVGVAGEVAEALRRTRFNQEVSPEEVRAALAEEVIRLVEPVMKPLRLDLGEEAVRHPRRRGQRQRQDDDDRQARQAIPGRRAQGRARRRRHVPRRGGRAAADLGRAHRLPGGDPADGVGRRRARLRRARPGPRRRQPTSC